MENINDDNERALVKYPVTIEDFKLEMQLAGTAHEAVAPGHDECQEGYADLIEHPFYISAMTVDLSEDHDHTDYSDAIKYGTNVNTIHFKCRFNDSKKVDASEIRHHQTQLNRFFAALQASKRHRATYPPLVSITLCKQATRFFLDSILTFVRTEDVENLSVWAWNEAAKPTEKESALLVDTLTRDKSLIKKLTIQWSGGDTEIHGLLKLLNAVENPGKKLAHLEMEMESDEDDDQEPTDMSWASFIETIPYFMSLRTICLIGVSIGKKDGMNNFRNFLQSDYAYHMSALALTNVVFTSADEEQNMGKREADNRWKDHPRPSGCAGAFASGVMSGCRIFSRTDADTEAGGSHWLIVPCAWLCKHKDLPYIDVGDFQDDVLTLMQTINLKFFVGIGADAGSWTVDGLITPLLHDYNLHVTTMQHIVPVVRQMHEKKIPKKCGMEHPSAAHTSKKRKTLNKDDN